MDQVRDALARTTEALTALGVPFAVVGGLAVSVRGEPRFTADVDIAVVADSDATLERWISVLGRSGYVAVATVEQDAVGRLATVRLRDAYGALVDLMAASCGVEAEVVAGASMVSLFGQPVPVVSVEALIAMKVLSASDDRLKDRQDLVDLIAVNPDFDQAEVRHLLTLIEARGYARKQDLGAKFGALCVGP